LDAPFWNEFPDCIDDVPISRNYVTIGVPNSDYVVFVTGRPAGSSTVAYALACNFQTSGNRIERPLAGTINFNPAFFTAFSGNTFGNFEFRAAVKVAVHEMSKLLPFFITIT
jgi:hypothetical protein